MYWVQPLAWRHVDTPVCYVGTIPADLPQLFPALSKLVIAGNALSGTHMLIPKQACGVLCSNLVSLGKKLHQPGFTGMLPTCRHAPTRPEHPPVDNPLCIRQPVKRCACLHLHSAFYLYCFLISGSTC